jgi:hypothetical protein
MAYPSSCAKCAHFESLKTGKHLCVKTGARFEIVTQRLTFSKLFIYSGIAFFANKFPRFYEDYLKGFFPARNIEAGLRIIK